VEEPTLIVAQNLKKMRENKNLSLDRLAELTGVSKSMLGQIERGESSPTISTIWKISNGLKISFTSLLNAPQIDTNVIQKASLKPLIEDNGKYRLYPLFTIETDRRFEIYAIEIEKGGSLSAEAHPAGTQEFLTVFAGELTVCVSRQEHRLREGDAIRFRADRPHVYCNSGEVLTKINLVIQYQE
jgi:XRE family transcriptional regulator, regulator of sulfur utilization